ncbi:uncharacterized protein CTRU02_209066 [Colletotrichum truncatum]|uniref:Uncharacterized protein n=1 Tax=Colletotrichum truncatum TaxID=5467 RepID=A0ACC3YY13_COLTU|nr:uncharacterized protein CTRU02_07743 [Colletotrichum truncatum]KAF6790837.1 hypothetical protein CTRU02_07743 [Colletotrichum truncatum]
MPSRDSDRRHRGRDAYDDDDDPYYDDDYYDRPRASRRVSRSAHELDAAEAGRSRRRRDHHHHDASPVRHSTRSRSLDHRPPPRRRRDSYDSYSDYSDSEDDRRRRRRDRDRGYNSGRRRDSRVSGASSSRSRLPRRESDKSHILQAAASAAVVAGATEAWRMRKDKTSWQKKGTKMATAAAGAAAIAAFKDNGPKDYGKKDAVGATIGGLLVNRLANGMNKK